VGNKLDMLHSLTVIEYITNLCMILCNLLQLRCQFVKDAAPCPPTFDTICSRHL